jgi:hypothetical protein
LDELNLPEDSAGAIDLTVHIRAANFLINEIITAPLTTAHLKEIERWLSAHFVAVCDPRIDTEKAGPVSVKYLQKVGMNLYETTFGQQAVALDTSQALAQHQAEMDGKTRRKGKIKIINPKSFRFGAKAGH